MPHYIYIACWVIFVYSLWDIYTTAQGFYLVTQLRRIGRKADIHGWAVVITTLLFIFDLFWLAYNITGGK